MKLIERKKENHQEIFTLELAPEEMEAALEDAYRHLVKEVDIDGFRKGKAPREILEQHVGKDGLFEHATKECLPPLLDEMLVDNGIKAFSAPSIKIVNREPATFEATVPLPPEITLGDYHSIKMKPNPVVIVDSQIDDIIKQAQQENADWKSIEEPAAMKDRIIMDITSEVNDTPFICAERDDFQLNPGWRFPAPGFSEELVGVKSGDVKDFKLNLPDTFADKSIAGKEVHFKITVHEVLRETLPEINDEFVKKVSEGCSTMEEFRQLIKDNLTRRDEEREAVDFENKVLEALVEQSQIAYPPVIVEYELNRMLREYVDRVRNSVQSEEEFNVIMKSNSEEKLRESYTPKAEQRVKQNLAIGKIIELEKIEATDEDVDKRITMITAQYGDDLKMLQERTEYLNKPQNREALRNWLAINKAVQWLIDKAKED
ncbi:MAG: trigger factor [Dehalococcoidia bacterium]|nr:trigger factor [Dehalococcoidia bacterium]